MKIRIGILFFVLCLPGCSHLDESNIQDIGVNPDIHIIDVDKAEKVESMFLSEICSQVKTIILETSDSVLLGNFSGMQVFKDLIFILDKRGDAALYAFNRDGKFIRRYGNRGIGPGEYLSIDDFTIDTENEIIYLMDDDASQILMYEIFTGKYINKIKLEQKRFNCYSIQYNNKRMYTDVRY